MLLQSRMLDYIWDSHLTCCFIFIDHKMNFYHNVLYLPLHTLFTISLSKYIYLCCEPQLVGRVLKINKSEWSIIIRSHRKQILLRTPPGLYRSGVWPYLLNFKKQIAIFLSTLFQTEGRWFSIIHTGSLIKEDSQNNHLVTF